MSKKGVRMKRPRARRKQSSSANGADPASTSPASLNKSEMADGAFTIVGIGASAGGLDPIRALLRSLPQNPGAAFIIVQHMAAGRQSELPSILARATKMKVREATDGRPIQPDHVYVIPPNNALTIKGGLLRLGPRPGPASVFWPSITCFNRSPATSARDRLGRIVGYRV